MIFIIVKSLHISTVVFSGLLFLWRGLRVIGGFNNTGFALKVLPHIIDTLLLSSAIYLAWILQLSPLQHHWLLAKITALLAYIMLGHYALKRAKNIFSRLFFVSTALTCFAYIIGAAHYHSIWSWWR